MSPDYLGRCQDHVSVFCARRIPAHLGCTQCSIMLHIIDICLISNQLCICLWHISKIETCNLFVCCCRTCICLDITRLYDDQRLPSSPPKTLNRETSTQFAQRLSKTAVTAPPLVCCVVWSLPHHSIVF